MAAIYIHLLAHVIASKDAIVDKPEFPLWSPKIELVVFGPDEEPAEPPTWAQAIWRRFNLNGLWFFLDWIVYPFFNWIVIPWWQWCVWPLIAPLSDFMFATKNPLDDHTVE